MTDRNFSNVIDQQANRGYAGYNTPGSTLRHAGDPVQAFMRPDTNVQVQSRAEPVSEIQMHQRMLEEALEHLGNQVRHLPVQLAPVLADVPVGDTNAGTGAPPRPQSPLATWLQDQTQAVHRLAAITADIAKRVQL